MAARKLRFKKGTKEKRQLVEWIDALRSGEFGQSEGVLQDIDGFCCLGVACHVLIPREKLKLEYDEMNIMAGSAPQEQPASPKWLNKINKDFHKRTGVSLMDMNDNGFFKSDVVAESDDLVVDQDVYNEHFRGNFTFEEIAQHLEDVYINEVLD